MRRRVGRPGLVGTMARTAVVAGTATAVSRGVSGAMDGKQQQQAAAQQQAQQSAYEQGQRDLVAQQQAAQAAQAAPAAAALSSDDRIEQLTKLGELKAAGVLTEEEFAAEKARILGS